MTTDRFNDDKATIRAELEKRASARLTITYGEAAALVSRSNQGLTQILNAIKDDEAAQGRPDLGCLIVRRGTGLPGNVGPDTADVSRALTVRATVFEAWADHS